LKTIQPNPKSNKPLLNQAIELAQNHPIQRQISAFGANNHNQQLI